jgi:hypothetical protein
MMNKHGDPFPVFYAKKLCTQHIRRGDWVSFPEFRQHDELDVAVARGDDGQRSALFVHLKGDAATYNVADFTGGDGAAYRTLHKIDGGTDNRIVQTPFDGRISFNGYGVAVVTNAQAK